LDKYYRYIIKIWLLSNSNVQGAKESPAPSSVLVPTSVAKPVSRAAWAKSSAVEKVSLKIF